jgi:hypothetical protein
MSEDKDRMPLGCMGIAVLTLIALALLATACNSSEVASPTPQAKSASSLVAAGSDYNPKIDPDDFVAQVDNPYFPLEPGTVFRLHGETEDEVEHETITVTSRTKAVMGVTTTVVKDVVRVDGKLVEFTFDWYAQDRAGNVWYFGEDTRSTKTERSLAGAAHGRRASTGLFPESS